MTGTNETGSSSGQKNKGDDRSLADMMVTVEHYNFLRVQKTKHGYAAEWRGKAAALIRVQAPPLPADSRRRFPIHLAVVIDVGSTMAWDAALSAGKPASRFDLLKKAVMFIIENLNDGDHLTVFFGDDHRDYEEFEISTYPKDAKGKVNKFFSGMADSSSKPSLKRAIKVLNEAEKDKGSQRLGFILLLSDGHEDSKFKLDKGNMIVDDVDKKYPVHALGLGKNHDPRALKLIADKSLGTYSCITGDLHVELMEGLGVSLGGLTSVVAVDTVIKVFTTDDDSAWKTTITKVESGGYQTEKKTGKNGRIYWEIHIRAIYACEEKKFILHLELNTPCVYKSGLTYQPIGAYGEYKDVAGETKDMVGTQQELSVMMVDDRPMEELLLSPITVMQEIVRAEVLRLVATKFLTDLHDLMTKPRYRSMKKEDVPAELASESGAMLLKTWEELQSRKPLDDEFLKAATTKNALMADLARLADDIKKMAEGLQEARLSVACVYAWVSWQQMQRATTTGLQPTASSFVTPDIGAMMKKAWTQQQEPAEREKPSNEQRPASPDSPDIRTPVEPEGVSGLRIQVSREHQGNEFSIPRCIVVLNDLGKRRKVSERESCSV